MESQQVKNKCDTCALARLACAHRSGTEQLEHIHRTNIRRYRDLEIPNFEIREVSATHLEDRAHGEEGVEKLIVAKRDIDKTQHFERHMSKDLASAMCVCLEINANKFCDAWKP